jgi:prophage regulatory protein
MPEDTTGPDFIVRLPAVIQFAGKSKTEIFEDVKSGVFPSPIRLSPGGRAIGWLRRELLAWQRERIAERDAMLAQEAAAKAEPDHKKKKGARS